MVKNKWENDPIEIVAKLNNCFLTDNKIAKAEPCVMEPIGPVLVVPVNKML